MSNGLKIMQLLKIETTAHGCVDMAHRWPLNEDQGLYAILTCKFIMK